MLLPSGKLLAAAVGLLSLAGGAAATWLTWGTSASRALAIAGEHTQDGTVHPAHVRAEVEIRGLVRAQDERIDALKERQEQTRDEVHSVHLKLERFLDHAEVDVPRSWGRAEDFAPASAPDAGRRDGGRR